MLAATIGWLTPVPAAIVQEVIDVAVIPPRAIRSLRNAGVKRIMMVTGDGAAAAQAIGAALDLNSVLRDCVPSDKVEAVKVEKQLHPTIMVGDGINDAPALASANVGVAMGARGASASSEAADVIILTDQIDRVGDAILIARRARKIAVQSIVAGMGLSQCGLITMAHNCKRGSHTSVRVEGEHCPTGQSGALVPVTGNSPFGAERRQEVHHDSR